jgi:HEPN domain-containing protein
MTPEEKVQYWLTSADNDWKVAEHLFDKKDYSYSLFLGHLTVEKLLKALFVSRFDEPPPFTHRLPFLAEKADLELSTERLELLEVITDFNLEARYPDEKFSFQKKCTKEFTENYLRKIEEIREWLLQLILSLK